jgi:hypothetical protein
MVSFHEMPCKLCGALTPQAPSGVWNIGGPEEGSAVPRVVAHLRNSCEEPASAFIQAYRPKLCGSEFRPVGLRYRLAQQLVKY